MSFFDKFKKNDPRTWSAIPESSTVMGTGGNYSDPRVFIRNLAYDALLGEAADEILYEVFDIPMVSQEGREALERDSQERLSRVAASMTVIHSAVDTILRIVAEINPKAADIPDEIKEKAIKYETDIARRCVLATLSCLVDLGLLETNMPKARMLFVESDDDDE